MPDSPRDSPSRRSRRSPQSRASARTIGRPPVAVAAGLAAVIVLKLIVMLQLKDHVLAQTDAGLDTTAYIGLAERVLKGDIGLGPGLYFLSPFYIYFLAAALAVWHSFTFVRLGQIVLGTAAVAFVFVTAREWFGRRAAWIAAALAALTGLFTFYESLLLQTAVDPFFTAAALACLTLALKRGEPRWYALAGLAFGIHVCNRPQVGVPAVLIALLLAATRRGRAAAAFSLAFGLALVPITLRNIVVSGYWSPVAASHGGLNFFIGNNADADGTFHAVPGVTPDIAGQAEETRRVAEQATGHALDDAAVSWFFYKRGWTWIRERPADAAALFARKLSLVFGAKYLWLNYSYRFFARDERTMLRVLVVGPWLLIPLGLIGLVIAAPRTDRSAYLIWGSFVPAYALAVAAFYVTDRYQLPMMIPLCAAAGAAVDVLIGTAYARQVGSLIAVGTALIAASAWVNRPLAYDEGVAEERTRMAERLVSLGRYDEAEPWAERAAQAHLHPGVVHFRVGQQLVAHDRPAAAIAHFEKALHLDPNQPVVEYALGETFLEAKRPRDAIAPLRRALDAGVHPDQAGFDLVRALGASGDRDEAIRVLAGLRPAQDDDAARWLELGQLAIQLQAPALTERFARKTIALRPDLAAAHRQLGDGFNLEGKWTDAARELDVAIRLDPMSAAPHIGLAVADANMGRLADARWHVEEALRLDPQSESAQRVRQALERSTLFR